MQQRGEKKRGNICLGPCVENPQVLPHTQLLYMNSNEMTKRPFTDRAGLAGQLTTYVVGAFWGRSVDSNWGSVRTSWTNIPDAILNLSSHVRARSFS